MIKIKTYIENAQKKEKVDAALRALIRKAVKFALLYEDFSRDCEVSVLLTDNEGIRELNREHRGKDSATDVLSFPMFDEDFGDGEAATLGDIVISLERAREQAESYCHSFERECAFLCVHSVLHLLGYDHENSKQEEEEMFARQESVLSLLGLQR